MSGPGGNQRPGGRRFPALMRKGNLQGGFFIEASVPRAAGTSRCPPTPHPAWTSIPELGGVS